MRVLLSIVLLATIASAGTAETITGLYSLWIGSENVEEHGPRFFGTLPDGSIDEIATASLSSLYDGLDTADMPLPLFGDGSSATLDQILFSVRFDQCEHGNDPTHQVEWLGGGSISVGCTGGNGMFTLEVWAFHPAAVPVAGIDFSQLKSLFK